MNMVLDCGSVTDEESEAMRVIILNCLPNKSCSWDLNQDLFGPKVQAISIMLGENEGRSGTSKESYRETTRLDSTSVCTCVCFLTLQIKSVLRGDLYGLFPHDEGCIWEDLLLPLQAFG